jgi:formylglycine-generating enzyme required for sulfatase activity
MARPNRSLASLFVTIFACAAFGCSTSTAGDASPSPTPGDDDGQDAATPDGASGSDAAPAKDCTKPSDCDSKICSAAGKCQPPKCDDNTTNGDETDLDCGGSCKACEDTKKCKTSADCTSGVCVDAGTGLQCQPPSNTDGVKNGSETDIDCGGAGNPKCGDAKKCNVRDDCASDVCDVGTGTCKTPVCDDGVKNGTETDIDCGGAGCPRCADLEGCGVADDCTSSVCKDVGMGLACQPPSYTDGVKNGTETDIDCGGDAVHPCAAGKSCLAHGDCQSNGCGYANKCSDGRSCTAHNGGDTCGSGGAGGAGAASWESCCTTATVAGVKIGKYQVTSGRMRAFLERTNGNVRKVVQDARAAGQLHGATMNASWDLYLPTSMEGCDQLGNCGASELTDHFYNDPGGSFQGIYTSALRQVGGSIFDGQSLGEQGCRIDAPGTHSYWMSDAVQTNYSGDKPTEQPQSVYDTKPLNCVNYLMAQSFCIWDGGRLETQAEYKAVGGPVDSGGAVNGAVPWGTPKPYGPGSNTFYGCRFPTATDAMLRGLPPGNACTGYIPPAGTSIEWADWEYSYEYPNLTQWDFIVFISAPGRLTARTNGIADLVGPIMEITSDVNNVTASPKTTAARWTANGSWEVHQWGYYGWNFSLVNKYGKQGLRCVYP